MKVGAIVASIGFGIVLGSCAPARFGRTSQAEVHSRPRYVIDAVYADQPIKVDGRLNENAWKDARAIPLNLRTDGLLPNHDRLIQEPGTVRLAWDEQYVYVGFEFVDRDVVQENDQDQQHFYSTGDVAELFLKPSGANYYWEFYVAPNGCKTSFFFPSRGRLGLQGNFAYKSMFRAGATVNGTLNDWHDDDRGWTGELAIPRSEWASFGIPLDDSCNWTLLAGRYNYGRQLSNVEVSCIPDTSPGNFHSYESYALLRLLPTTKP